MDPNAFTVPFQATKSLKRELYKSIDPKNPQLKATGKTILITGATGGLGGEIARAWATAGAKGIALVGQKKELLEEPIQAIKAISSSTQVLALTADITSESDVEALFKQVSEAFGVIDVVVHTAGSMVGGPVGDLPPNEWFRDFEVNVKGSYILAHYYLKLGQSGTLIILGTLGASFTVPGMSAYSGSKMALLKLAEYLDAEKPNLRVFTVHPGIVAATDTNRGMVVESLTPFAIDKGIQAGGLSLYLAQPKADYLKGSFISVNWDVDELEAHKSEITEKQLLKLGFLKAQLGPEGHPWS
ncbi:NAD(P)-binding protein [Delitschia confertaspora ATCC 74209]|uniref:NAD(P)-binding protein n=1 Tax=Delitschia confertaspora ATCC 74209 TaxID=1513339 RepID=A0A9P4JS56_9PLEO|nr:NAD(P)-binding protein [Delitschia confertaspora ATCC 74209]